LSIPLLLFYVFGISTYVALLLLTGAWVMHRSRDPRLGFLVIPGIFLTHIYYGIMFLRGFFAKEIKRNVHPFFWQRSAS
jgi:hypothetical protein